MTIAVFSSRSQRQHGTRTCLSAPTRGRALSQRQPRPGKQLRWLITRPPAARSSLAIWWMTHCLVRCSFTTELEIARKQGYRRDGARHDKSHNSRVLGDSGLHFDKSSAGLGGRRPRCSRMRGCRGWGNRRDRGRPRLRVASPGGACSAGQRAWHPQPAVRAAPRVQVHRHGAASTRRPHRCTEPRVREPHPGGGGEPRDRPDGQWHDPLAAPDRVAHRPAGCCCSTPAREDGRAAERRRGGGGSGHRRPVQCLPAAAAGRGRIGAGVPASLARPPGPAQRRPVHRGQLLHAHRAAAAGGAGGVGGCHHLVVPRARLRRGGPGGPRPGHHWRGARIWAGVLQRAQGPRHRRALPAVPGQHHPAVVHRTGRRHRRRSVAQLPARRDRQRTCGRKPDLRGHAHLCRPRHRPAHRLRHPKSLHAHPALTCTEWPGRSR